MLLLQLETATSVCSCALSIDGRTIAVKEENEPNIHGAFLTLFIQELMEDAGYELTQLDGIAVSMGPGSYTGLRIGVSTAKGLCYALDKPLLAVNTLDAMASGYLQRRGINDATSTYLCPMIDARRMEVYLAVYDADLVTVNEVSAQVIDGQSFNHLPQAETILLFGDGARKLSPLFERNKQIEIIADFGNSAADLSRLAFQKAQNHQFENVAYFEPFYLKDFIPTQAKKKNNLLKFPTGD